MSCIARAAAPPRTANSPTTRMTSHGSTAHPKLVWMRGDNVPRMPILELVLRVTLYGGLLGLWIWLAYVALR